MKILRELTDGLTGLTDYYQIAANALGKRVVITNPVANTVTVPHRIQLLASVETGRYATQYTVEDIDMLTEILQQLESLQEARELATDVGDYEGRQQEILIADAEELYKRT